MTAAMLFLVYLWVFYLGFVLYAGCQNAIAQRAWLVILPLIANGSDTASTTLPTQPNYPAGT